MKKENRKIAQQRRAEERKKREQINKGKRMLKIGIPILILVIILAAVLVNAVRNTDTSEDTASETETVTEASAAAGYSTDTSLTVEDGDTVNIDYVGTVDGVEFDGGSTDGGGTDLVIGSGSYIDDFEEQLVGAHPGDTVEVTVTFPEDYGVDELNGKEAVFTTIINGIYE